MTNPQRNEHLIKIGEFETIAKMTLDKIVRMESAFDLPLFEIAKKQDGLKLSYKDLIQIIEITSTKPIDKELLEEQILEEGTMVAMASVTPLLLSAFMGQKNLPKSERPEAAKE